MRTKAAGRDVLCADLTEGGERDALVPDWLREVYKAVAAVDGKGRKKVVRPGGQGVKTKQAHQALRKSKCESKQGHHGSKAGLGLGSVGWGEGRVSGGWNAARASRVGRQSRTSEVRSRPRSHIKEKQGPVLLPLGHKKKTNFACGCNWNAQHWNPNTQPRRGGECRI